MYEAEANVRVEAADQIPSAIKANFLELRSRVLSRTVLPWSEHCTECVWPTCYSTCEFYDPREDGRCRRFVDGILAFLDQRNENPNAFVWADADPILGTVERPS